MSELGYSVIGSSVLICVGISEVLCCSLPAMFRQPDIKVIHTARTKEAVKSFIGTFMGGSSRMMSVKLGG